MFFNFTKVTYNVNIIIMAKHIRHQVYVETLGETKNTFNV